MLVAIPAEPCFVDFMIPSCHITSGPLFIELARHSLTGLQFKTDYVVGSCNFGLQAKRSCGLCFQWDRLFLFLGCVFFMLVFAIQIITLLGSHINRAQVHLLWGLGSPSWNGSAIGPLKAGHVGERDSCILICCDLVNLKDNWKAMRGKEYEALGCEVGQLRRL